MASRICKAILDLAITDFDSINKQANRFLDNLYEETTLYADPPISKADFALQTKHSTDATFTAIDGGKMVKSLRNTECKITHRMMSEKIIPYINGLYAGNRPLIERSGAKSSMDPSPIPPPDQPIIKCIKKGALPNTVKIYLVRGINSKQKRRAPIYYRIMMFENENDILGTEVGSTYNSTNLIGKDVPFESTCEFSVIASNSNGSSPPSARVSFYLQ